MRPLAGSAPLAWLAALAFFCVVLWPHLFQRDVPLFGLRALASPQIGWPLALVSAAMALFLSVPAFLTRERRLVCAGFSLCLFLVLVFYVSPAAGVVFGFIGANLIRESANP